MTEDEIADHSKSDLFKKLITGVQVFSAIVQIIVRRAKNLTISQLELAVTAFSMCAIIIYLLVLYQPKDVQTVKILHNDNKHLTFEEAYKICVEPRYDYSFNIKDKSYYQKGGFDEGIPYSLAIETQDCDTVVVFFGGITFGILHCFGWFFSFPTWEEQLLSRIACVATTSIPLIIFVLLLRDYPSIYDFLRVGTVFLTICYVIARLFIAVEVFR